MFVVFISILVHELGHAFTMKAFGYQPSVVIEWFGGRTSPNTNQPIPWLKDVALTLAGPLAGLALGLTALFAFRHFAPVGSFAGPIGRRLLGFLAGANIVWTLVNLMPVLPLDGGRISHTVLTRFFGRRGILFSQGIGLVASVAVVALSLRFDKGDMFVPLYFGMFGFQALQVLMAYFSGKQAGAEPHPAELAFAQATGLFREGRLADAQRLAERALRIEPPPHRSVHLKLRHLMGWISLKEGRGQEALDHFARMESQEVEAHALAAAFSLAGDDVRALPLWELAAKSGGDATLLHEYAGALIRSGRVEDARRLTNVDMLAAWRAAERVPSIRGDFDAAANLGRQAMMEYPRPDLAYDTACALARAGRIDDAQQMLDQASELGFSDAAHADGDSDLDPLRSTPAYVTWIKRVRETRAP
jgi:Zn-dependent protease/Flp pilus assembly protein TadD